MGDIPIAMITLRFPTPQDEHDHGRDDHRGVTSDSTDHVDSPSNSRGLANHFHSMGHLDHNYVTKFQRVYKKSGQLGWSYYWFSHIDIFLEFARATVTGEHGEHGEHASHGGHGHEAHGTTVADVVS